jgi:acetate kinase
MLDGTILVINAGSSSLKVGAYAEAETDEHLVVSGSVDGIGSEKGALSIQDANGRALRSEVETFTTPNAALHRIVACLGDVSRDHPRAVGHRVVHGGPRLLAHQRITPEVIAELGRCVHFAPLHVPIALELIDAASRLYPDTPQYACFDTVVHRTIAEVASRFAIPKRFFDEGVRRYGFHGLSYESILHELGDRIPRRTVIAHLGSGASLAAIKDGKSIDTTMGLTPTGGIPMATRSGDLDPGVLLYLLRTHRMDADALENLLNHESGLKALSEGRSDMRELEAAAARGDASAILAIEIFCRSILKTIASYAAILGGLDLLVFTGGIGEHSEHVRLRVCDGLAFMGKIEVMVIAARENLQIARHCRALLRK